MSRDERQLLEEPVQVSDADDVTYDERETLSRTTLTAIVMSSVGGLMFGYDTGVISGVLVLLGTDLGSKMSEFQLEVITSVTSVFALFGCIATGVACDIFGRKPLIAVACVVFIIAAFLMALAPSYWVLVCGRAVVGLAVGSASTVVPVYIAELAPAKYRGRLVIINSLSTTGGQVLAYLSGTGFQYLEHGWRYMLGVSAIPPLAFLLGLGVLPESPRFHLLNGDIELASEVLSKLHPDASPNDIERIIEHRLALAGSGNDDHGYSALHGAKHPSSLRKRINDVYKTTTGDLHLLFSVTSNIRALSVGCGLMASQQLCGFNSFMYYSGTMFAAVGFTNPITVSLVVAVTNFLFTCIAVHYIDSVGRRKMLLNTVWIMVVALVAAAFAFGNDLDAAAAATQRQYLQVASSMTFVAAYSAGLGNIPWQAVEFLPLEVRSLGSMMIASTGWICNFFISLTFLSLIQWIHAFGTFLLYAFITMLAYIGIVLYYPEVAGMQLEEIKAIFENGFGVRRSHRR